MEDTQPVHDELVPHTHESLSDREDLTREATQHRTKRVDLLVDRNDIDNIRQDESDARQDRTEEQISGINRLVLDGLARIEIKSDRLGERMDNLVDTTNHRLDDFRISMDIHERRVNESLDTVVTSIKTKADKDELLTSMGERMMTNSLIRWGVGILFAALVGTATIEQWWSGIFRALTK